MFALQQFGAGRGHAQPVGQIVGDVSPADGDDRAVLDHAVRIHDVFRGARPNVHDEDAHLLLIVVGHGQRGTEAAEDQVINLHVQPAQNAHVVLQAGGDAVDDVHVHLQPLAEHADGIGDAGLAIHGEVAAHALEHGILRGPVEDLGIGNDFLHVLRGNLVIERGRGEDAARIQAGEMSPGHAEIHAGDLDVGGLLRLDDGVANILGGLIVVHDFALAHAPGGAVAQADDVERASLVHLADDDAHLGGANVEADDDRGLFGEQKVKHFSSDRVRV